MLVDDHEVVRDGVRSLLESADDSGFHYLIMPIRLNV